MLKIRLARVGRRKRPVFRIVLTEHTKSPKAGYKEQLGTFDPIKKDLIINIDAIKEWISKGAQPSERVAKLAFRESGDKLFEKYFVQRDLKRETRNPDKFDA